MKTKGTMEHKNQTYYWRVVEEGENWTLRFHLVDDTYFIRKHGESMRDLNKVFELTGASDEEMSRYLVLDGRG